MRRAVARQMVGSVLGAVSSVLGSILVFIAAGKALGPELFGTFALTYAIISLLGLIFDFGYTVSFLRNTRKPADNSPGELPKQALGLKVALFVVLTPFAVGVPFLTGTNLLVGMVLWVGLSLISLGNFYSTMLRAIGLHSKDAVNLFISNFAGLVVAGVTYFAWPEGLGFSFVFATIGVVYCTLTMRLWTAHFRLSGGRFVWADILVEMRKNFVYMLDAMGRRSFGFFDVAILGLFAPVETVGLYQAAQKVTQGVGIFAQPFNNVLLPRLSQSAGDVATFNRKARTAFVAQLFFGLAAGAVLVVLGPSILSWLFSEAFMPAAELFSYFAALIMLRYATSALKISKTAQGFFRERLYANLFSVAALLVIGPVLTYVANVKGLLVGLILSNVLGSVVLILLTRQRPVSK